MSRRRKWRAVAATGLALCVSCCGGAVVTLTAAKSVNPVMFGPVTALGKGTPSRGTGPDSGGTPFRHLETNIVRAEWHYLFLETSRLSITNPAGVDETDPNWGTITSADAPLWLDWRVFRATTANPDRRVDVTSVRCGGTNLFVVIGHPLVGYGSHSMVDCELEGFVTAAE